MTTASSLNLQTGSAEETVEEEVEETCEGFGPHESVIEITQVETVTEPEEENAEFEE